MVMNRCIAVINKKHGSSRANTLMLTRPKILETIDLDKKGSRVYGRYHMLSKVAEIMCDVESPGLMSTNSRR